MVVVVVVWAPHCRWLMVVVLFVGGCSWPFVVGVGGWWWCSCRHVGGAGHSSSFVGGAAGCSTLVAVGFWSSLLSVTVHRSSVSSLSGVISFHVVTCPLTCRWAFSLRRGNEVGG